MLKKDTRRQLKEHGWLEIAKKHSNPTLALKRLKDQAFEAINDLTLFAQKLPTQTLNEIFNKKTNFEKLIDSVLMNKKDADDIDNKNNELSEYTVGNTRLASMLVKKGINFCIDQYTNKIETNSVLNRLTISQLKESIDICDEIAFKMRLHEIKSVEDKEGLIYLFNFDKIKETHETMVPELRGEDTRKFIEFLEYDRPIAVVNNISANMYSVSDNADDVKLVRKFEFTNVFSYHSKGKIEIDLDNNTAYVFIEEDVANEGADAKTRILARDLVTKIENQNVCVYKKKENVYASWKKR